MEGKRAAWALGEVGGRWDPWVSGDDADTFTDEGLARLARYVCPDALTAMNKLIEPEQETLRGEGTLALVERLYGRLSAWNRPYNREPWLGRAGTSGQRIRDPEWINRDSGTCLDLAMAFASSCAHHHLRPLVTVFLPDDQNPVGHAVVLVVDTTSAPDGLSSLGGGPAKGVWRLKKAKRLRPLIEKGQLVAVDPTMATREHQLTFTDSRSVVLGLTNSRDAVALVDVVGLISRGEQLPYGRPDPRYRPPIGCRLTSMPPYRRVAAHQDLVDDLSSPRRSSGITVLAGPPGVGKSRLAHHVVEQRDDGCGWFLSATSPSTLMESLAAAEIAESGGSVDALTRVDRVAYAQAALHRLQTANTSWAVVIDNAEAPDAELLRWIPAPEAAQGQQVIVTTTDDHHDAWAANHRVVPVPPLQPAEVREFLPELSDEALALVAGRYLMIRALKSYCDKTGAVPTGDPPSDSAADRGAAWIWSAVRTATRTQPGIEAAALAAAVLCPTPLSAALVKTLGFESALDSLVAHGICEHNSDGGVAIHRLFATSIRHDLGDDSNRAIALELLLQDGVVNFLRQRLESETLDRLRQIIRTITTVSTDLGRAHHALGSIQELHGDTLGSASSYELAQPILEEAGLDLLVADCLLGRARRVNQHQFKDPDMVSKGIEWAKQARNIHETLLAADAPDAVPPGPARCRAMEGLLEVKVAKQQPPAVRGPLLQQALAVLRDSEDERRLLLEHGEPESRFDRLSEIARSAFNVAGPWIELAKLEQGDAAATALDRAQKVYESVLKTRQEELGLWAGHPHLAASEHGLGIVHYYRAILQPDAPVADRTAWLRQAELCARLATDHRAALDGPFDAAEATKGLRLLAKIVLARHALAEAHADTTRRPFEQSTTQLLSETLSELREAGLDLSSPGPP